MAAIRSFSSNDIILRGLRGDSACLFAAEQDHPLVWITSQKSRLTSIQQTLSTFAPQKRTLVLPAITGSPYAFMPQHESTKKERIESLEQLKCGKWDIIITQPQGLLQKLPPKNQLLNPTISLITGQTHDLSSLIAELEKMGYRRVELVSQVGEFAGRGGIVDIYPLTHPAPSRIEFFDDEIEDIRQFDPSTQRSDQSVTELTILPHTEWCMGTLEKACFSQKGKDLWNATRSRTHFVSLVDQLNQLNRFPGYEHWTSLFFQETSVLESYIPDNAAIFFDDRSAIEEAIDEFFGHLELQEEEARKRGQIFAPASMLYHLPAKTNRTIQESRTVYVHDVLSLSGCHQEFTTKSVPKYHGRFSHFIRDYGAQTQDHAVIVTCRTVTSCGKLEDLFLEHGMSCHRSSFPLTGNEKPGFYIAQGTVQSGFTWEDRNLVILGEGDLWDSRTVSRQKRSPTRLFQSEFRDLKVGDLVIHEDHGVGQFLGLVEMAAGGGLHEMMALSYRDGNRLYVSLNQLDKVQRFCSEDTAANLDKLGGVTWEKKRRRARQSVKKLAIDLLKLQAERHVASPLQCGPDTPWQREFEDQFAYELTSDQAHTVDEIKKALEESDRPMDRLLVGDVGFGKTEVAMRIAFKIVNEGGQVAVLCPTTVLAFQHFLTFRDRFSHFPVTIQWLSRFSKTSERRAVLTGLSGGQVDVVIGTHRLLSEDVDFKQLSFLIVDEEQRFGVGHKEKLKDARKGIHVLSMSATPIPRSMHMAFSGIRDISIIQTPPRNRLSICTSVMTYSNHLVKNAINFELNRQGQVYFVHNRVETMGHVVTALRELLPHARIDMAHGQMESRLLERVMLRFIRQEVDVLVASTIIENGLDIANANTMIINHADQFGMSQLYQLRGRIGRSDKPAYAYLMVPPRKIMKPEARKRLAALEEFSDLGSGFRIAALDMEIRGTGNLLGPEQAGHIHAIGLEMYLRMLKQSVLELQGLEDSEPSICTLSLKTEAAIPRNYMQATNQRIHYYRRISSIASIQDAEDIALEIADCYGPIPEEMTALLAEAKLRVSLTRLGVQSVEREGQNLNIRFFPRAEVESAAVTQFLTSNPDARVLPDGLLIIPIKNQLDSQALVERVVQLVQQLVPSQSLDDMP